jgi:hypothetical protein
MERKIFYASIGVQAILLLVFALIMYGLAPEFFQRPMADILLAYFGCVFFPAYSAGRLNTYAELGKFIQITIRDMRDRRWRLDPNNPQHARLLTMLSMSILFFMILYAYKLKSQPLGFMVAGIFASCVIGAVLGWDLVGLLIRWRGQGGRTE